MSNISSEKSHMNNDLILSLRSSNIKTLNYKQNNGTQKLSISIDEKKS